MPRITKKQMEERYDRIIDDISRAQQLEKKQAEAYFDKEMLELHLRISNLQGQIEVYREVLGLNREHIIENISNEEDQDADKQ